MAMAILFGLAKEDQIFFIVIKMTAQKFHPFSIETNMTLTSS